jgi:hypothetical protein
MWPLLCAQGPVSKCKWSCILLFFNQSKRSPVLMDMWDCVNTLKALHPHSHGPVFTWACIHEDVYPHGHIYIWQCTQKPLYPRVSLCMGLTVIWGWERERALAVPLKRRGVFRELSKSTLEGDGWPSEGGSRKGKSRAGQFCYMACDEGVYIVWGALLTFKQHLE